MVYYLMFIIVGIIIGFISGMFGLSGGVLLIPTLVFLGFDQKTAAGTTLAMMLPPIGILAFLEYYKKGLVNMPVAIMLIIGFLFGSKVSAAYAISLNENILRISFGILLIIIGLLFIFGATK